ncbi:MAG TPA: hypothetical protein VMF05_06320 [Stellaceae bacterium]|nr:hypothetical protein [Stellaceae bacterium]
MAFAARAAMAIAVVLSVSVWQSAEAAGPLRAFARGLWSGGAYTDDRTGEFTHCSAGVAYDSGINLFVLVTAAHHWWLGFIDPQWTFAAKASLEVELRFDRGIPVPRGAMLPRDDLLLVPLPDNSNLVETFRNSTRLTLVAQGEAYRFKLADVPAVLDALSGCVGRSVALAENASSSGGGKLPRLSDAAIPAATKAASAFTGGSISARPPTSAQPATSARPATKTAASVVAATSSSNPDITGSPRIAGDGTTPPPPASVSPASASSASVSGGSLPAPPGSIATNPREQSPGPQLRVAAASTASLPRAAGLSVTVAPSPVAAPDSAAIASLAARPAASQQQVPPSQPPALEEIRLAHDFFTSAGLPNARLVTTDKPPALAGFAAVWRSDAAAGAVKIIPPGRNVSGVGIASDLIAVDPRMCNGDFTAERSSEIIDHDRVFSAILSCTEAGEQRTAQYFVTPRRQGGFVVFAVVRSDPAGAPQQRIDQFTRAAARAAGNDG